MLLNRRKKILPFIISLRADGGASSYLPVCVEESGSTRGRSFTSLDDFGTASCFTVFLFPYEQKRHESYLSRRDTAADPAGQSKITLPGTGNPRVGTLTMTYQSSSRGARLMDQRLSLDLHQDRKNQKLKGEEGNGGGHGTKMTCSKVNVSLR